MSIWKRLAYGIAVGLTVGVVLGVIAGMLSNQGLDAASKSFVLFSPTVVGVLLALRRSKQKPQGKC